MMTELRLEAVDNETQAFKNLMEATSWTWATLGLYLPTFGPGATGQQ